MTETSSVPLDPTSRLMKHLLKLGLVRFAWSLRRFHAPVSKEALVLEAGSGGNPYFWANVLLDAYEHTREWHFGLFVATHWAVVAQIKKPVSVF